MSTPDSAPKQGHGATHKRAPRYDQTFKLRLTKKMKAKIESDAAKAGLDCAPWLRALITGTAPIRSSEAARARARQNQLLALVAQELCGLREDVYLHERPSVETLLAFDALALRLFAAIRAAVAPLPDAKRSPPRQED